MLQTIGQNPQRQCLHSGNSLLPSPAVSHNAREFRNLRQPAAILFPLDFNLQIHGSNILTLLPVCRTQTRPRLPPITLSTESRRTIRISDPASLTPGMEQ